MVLIAVSQRVDSIPDRGERRDSLDQRWARFLTEAGLSPLPLPNHLDSVRTLVKELPIGGVLLTGGNDLVGCGGDAPERDEVETFLIDLCLRDGRPLMGVCRGMQSIQAHFGIKLERVDGHVRDKMTIPWEGKPIEVVSHHRWGTRETAPELEVLSRHTDQVVKAVRHAKLPLLAVMWHPERMSPFSPRDLSLIRSHFKKKAP